MNRKGKKKYTIQEHLAGYLGQLLIFLGLILITSVGFYWIMNENMIRENQHLVELTDFFERLNSMNYALSTENSGEVLSETYEADLTELEEGLNSLDRYRVNVSYKRNIEELHTLFKVYRERISMISTEDYQEGYRKTAEVYQAMCGYERPLRKQTVNQEKELTQRRSREIFFHTVLLVVTLVLLGCYIVGETRSVARSVTQPLQKLTGQIAQLDFNRLPDAGLVQSSESYHDEINRMITGYNEMLKKIKKQMTEHEEFMNMQLLLKRLEYKNIQQQINPHFLFNTLNMIAQSAYLDCSPETVSLVKNLSSLLRYALDYSDRSVTLEKEIEALGSYVYLQEQRFQDRIRFVFELDESFHQIKIPNFILQPLLENAIVHGMHMFEQGGKICIRTKCNRETQMGEISIIDNGAGMDEKKLEEVRTEMKKADQKKIGLSNVWCRLQIYFEGRADIRIESVPGKRTEVTVLIPLEKEKTGVFINDSR